MRLLALLVSALAFFASASVAAAADHSLVKAKLVLQRTATKEKLVLVARDPGVLFPALGSADDPTTASAAIEIFSTSEGFGSMVAPAGAGKPGWISKAGSKDQHQYANADAPAPPSPVRTIVLKEVNGLRVLARDAGLAMAAAQGSIGIRLTTGSLRNCARFTGAAIKKDAPGIFRASITASSVADCSGGSLGAAGTCGDSVGSMCNGTCAPGEECVTTAGGFECVCLPPGSTPCGTPSVPTCGGDCPTGAFCNPVFLPIGAGGGLSCSCNAPGCGNGFAWGIDDFGNGSCFPITCASYPDCHGEPCGDGGVCSPWVVELVTPPLHFCICALPADCCTGGFTCPGGEACIYDGGCSCAVP